MKIIFAGTPDFAAEALRALAENGHDIALVLTQPDRPSGRGMKLTPSPVKVLAESLGIPVETPATLSLKKDPEGAAAMHEKLRNINADLLVVAAYGLILPEPVLNRSEEHTVRTASGKLATSKRSTFMRVCCRAGAAQRLLPARLKLATRKPALRS